MSENITKTDAKALIRYIEYLEQIVEAEGYRVGADEMGADAAYWKLMNIAEAKP